MFLKEWLASRQSQQSPGACEQCRALGPAPGPHDYHVPLNPVSSALYARWRSSALVSLRPQSRWVGSISTLCSPHLCKPHSQGILFYFHTVLPRRTLSQRTLFPFQGFMLVSDTELTFAILQFTLPLLGPYEKHQDLYLRAESSG